ncbi:hypothetical protein FRC01_010575 [Tulasnella sp. 417]|nr:hypothetical protein FRC01_010575 [Tulasnella sp. 417]
MADSPNNRPKVTEFKTLCRMVISDSPLVEYQDTTNTHSYTPSELPRANVCRPLQLVHDPDIPNCLIDGLDRFADGLQESELDSANLAEARIELQRRPAARTWIDTENSVLPGFVSIIVDPVYFLCKALDFEVRYKDASQYLNIIPGRAWAIDEQEIAIFEHKSPSVAGHHFKEIVSLAKKRETLDLSKSSTGAEGIISKLALASIGKGLEYCAIHCLASYIFIRIVRGRGNEPHHVRISDEIPLNCTATPIIGIALGLLLHAKKHPGFEYREVGVQVATTDNVSSEQGTNGSGPSASAPGPSAPGPHTSPNQQGGASPSNPPAEYWEPRELSEGALAELLSNMDGISVYWDMRSLSKTIQRLLRWRDSSIWNDSSQVEAIHRIIPHLSKDGHYTLPPSPPMVPLVLRLNSTVGHGAVGSVYRGSFHDLSVPIIVKVLPAKMMGHELDIWRRLSGLAGMGVPGLFGAYSIKGEQGSEDTGALIQEDAGTSISSFDRLNAEQRQVSGIALYRYVKLISAP